jgi:[ribosomal protein S18]-alanine N-acetyltransferase
MGILLDANLCAPLAQVKAGRSGRIDAMMSEITIRLAKLADAADIAAMARDDIEQGLPWTWRAGRVARAVRAADTNVAVVGEPKALLAFGIMIYRDLDAHLLLLAVRHARRRQGIGSRLMVWLEEVARGLGIQRIRVECRRDNAAARNFYAEHAFHELSIERRWYRGIADGVLLEKRLVPAAGS